MYATFDLGIDTIVIANFLICIKHVKIFFKFGRRFILFHDNF